MESKLSVFDEVLAELAYAIGDNDRLTGAQIDAQMSELRNRYKAASSKEPEPNKCVYCRNEPMQADLLYTDVDVKTIVYVENEMLHLESASKHVAVNIGFCPACGRDLHAKKD
jgi:hypothetical protein